VEYREPCRDDAPIVVNAFLTVSLHLYAIRENMARDGFLASQLHRTAARLDKALPRRCASPLLLMRYVGRA